MRYAVFFISLLLAAGTAPAQVRPQPVAGDPRIQTVLYDADQVVELHAVPGYQLGLEFAADELIENVAIGDSAGWQVTPNRRGSHLFVKALARASSTNMTVVTSTRTYLFELVPAFDRGQMAYTVRFTYPGSGGQTDAPTASAEVHRYRLRGARALRPSRISDDGTHTYIDWPADRPLPAIYALNARGEETLVNGAMRDGIWVINGVSNRLVFRIDRAVAYATRLPQPDER